MVIDARRKKGPSAVLVSLEDFESWQETAYLMRSPAMHRRLRRAVAQIESGKAKPRKLTAGEVLRKTRKLGLRTRPESAAIIRADRDAR